MFGSEAKDKGSAGTMPTSYSSSENDQKRERIENYKDLRRRELSMKYGSRQDSSTKSFKSTRKKEDLKGGGTCGPFLKSYLNSQLSENQVPLSDSRRHLLRRDGNKTDFGSGNPDVGVPEPQGTLSPRESVLVRETKASRLRAATRTPPSDAGSSSPKYSRDPKKFDKEKTPLSGSLTWNSLNRKDVDKSHTRKSHLNRSHTSEGVYDDIYVPGGSNVRRRGAKTSSLESSPVKDKLNSNRFGMGNTNGGLKDFHPPSDPTPRTAPRSPLNLYRKSPNILEKCSPLKTTSSGDKTLIRKRDSDLNKPKIPDTSVGTLERRLESRKSSVDKFKQIDIATRAEILAASTLKMINRLDEINSKSRRAQEKATLKKPLPFNSVISSNSFSDNNTNDKTETKKVPLDENTAKSSSTRRNSRSKADVKPTAALKVDSPKKSLKSDIATKPSILKNRPGNSPEAQKSKPVSILKRKSLSQDEGQSSSPPVTFSPSVLKKESDPKRQGILKKRRSLDENEVMRRRSYSPDANDSDFKSILKNQRRSSMEELTRRSHSPDSAPQGILKRKSSKDEEIEDNMAEPQGILKRKSLPSLSSNQHVKISDSFIQTASTGIAEVQVCENVRPILKKKSSSEEHSASDLSLTEVPKSILKKKTSLETDETEDKPKKPILKSSKISSFEEPEDGKRSRALIFNAVDLERVKPILKSRSVESGNEETEVVLRRLRNKREDRPSSSSDIDNELSAIFLKRRSLEFQPVCAIDWEFQKTKKASSNERLRGDLWRRPLSVAEKIVNLENFLEVERLERERRNSPPGTPPHLISPKVTPSQHSFFDPESTSTGAVPRKTAEAFGPLSQSAHAMKSAYDTDSLTLENQSPAHEDAIGESSHSLSACPRKNFTFNSLTNNDLETPQTSSKTSSENIDANRLPGRESFHSIDSAQGFAVFPSTKANEKHEADAYLDFCGVKISSLSLEEAESFRSCTEEMESKEAEDLSLLQRSGSVSAKTSLFKEMERKFKADAEEKTKKIPKETNTGVNRRREKKLLESNSQRYHTQPVSSEDVEMAVWKSKSSTDAKCEDEAENHEDELSTMSYKDRLKLFESTFTPKFFEPTAKRRGTRNRTQPVTTVEVEKAKTQTLSSSLVNAPNERETNDANNTLSRPTSERITNILKPHIPKIEDKIKPKGILKNLNQNLEPKEQLNRKLSSDSEESDTEKKGILKNELSESFKNLKKVLKKVEKETNVSKLKGILKQPSTEKKLSSSEEEEDEEEDEDLEKEQESKQTTSPLRANLAAILQKVEPGKAFDLAKDRHTSKYKKNAGIPREINKLRNNSSIVKSQSHSSVSSGYRPTPRSIEPENLFGGNNEPGSNGETNKDEIDESPMRLGGLKRSTTQPLANPDGTDDDMSGCSIQERLARLKRRGELDWQKRKSHVTNLEDELSVITAANYLFNENCLLREKNRSTSPQKLNGKQTEELRNSSSILADRLGKLDAAKDGWKKRIKPSDAVRFSVEGKMLENSSPPNASLQISPNRTPLAERKKRIPKATKFRSKLCNPSLSSMPSSPLKEINNPISRSVSAPGSGKDGLFSLSSPDEVRGPVITVPKNDDETFTSFFGKLSTERILEERLEINDEDLDVVTRMKSSQLLVQKKNIKTQKRRATVRNPVKALAARLDLQEYTEVKTGIAEKELKRIKIEKAAKNSNLAIEALAGLASQEDFTSVNLKKASEGGFVSPDAPYKDLMLLQIKGRRHVQTRLIEPKAKNINAGDCFILVTPNKVFHYIGKFANVIERSRGAEISSHIQQKGDLGCSANSVVTIGEGGRATKEQIKEFWSLLGGEPSCEKEAGNLDEDELFESALVDTNMVYEMVDDELVPNENFWGSIPKIEILDPNKILVFDFGSEFYVWNGKNVNLPQRKIALKLAKELWEEGFDYTECDVCPLTAAARLGGVDQFEEVPDFEKAGPVRPSWALFAKITQNMETVLFREKFLDWPDYSRVIRRTKKGATNDQGDSNTALDLKPCDAKKMLENSVPEPDLILEGSHLGRGIRYFDEDTRRCSEITTQDITVWHVKEYEYSEVPPESVGHFYTQGSYVVRWHYVITITGRELSGQPSKHLTTGRNRYAYFFWQGRDSPINDKGAAACLTVELDKEHGPQVRVVEGLEPPAFLNLFQGKMVVHSEKRCFNGSKNKWRLFICRGESESESVLFEVPCSMRQLRSAASFLLINRQRGKIIVWHGWKSLEHTRKIAINAAEHIQSDLPKEFGFEEEDVTVREELEGRESQDFIRALGGDNRQLYYSLLEDKTFEVTTPRLFHLTSVSGEFLFTEVASPYLTKDTITPFPFLQTDIYSASQPALFLLDSSSCLWLWQGWWDDNSETDRGSGYVRFQAERKAAMSSVMSYWKLKYGDSTPKAYLIWAGLEPLQFTNQFPFWNDRDDIAEVNMKDGRKPGDSVLVKTELASLTQSTYPLAQLQNRPLPDGVNPTSLEDYLESQCFPELFGIEKEEFYNLPSWKKKKMKQEVGLF